MNHLLCDRYEGQSSEQRKHSCSPWAPSTAVWEKWAHNILPSANEMLWRHVKQGNETGNGEGALALKGGQERPKVQQRTEWSQESTHVNYRRYVYSRHRNSNCKDREKGTLLERLRNSQGQSGARARRRTAESHVVLSFLLFPEPSCHVMFLFVRILVQKRTPLSLIQLFRYWKSP